ncbi:MAG: dTMP kinase [bacterium]
MKKGLFITFEGIDCSGKSTQVELLVEHLRQAGREVIVPRDPGGTEIGEKIRSILLDKKNLGMSRETELFLFGASRSQLVQDVILPSLQEGNIVVCDRFYDSTTAYQGWGRGLSIEAIRQMNQVAARGLIPDITFFIDIPIDEIGRRMKKQQTTADRMESNGTSFYENVRAGYFALAAEDKRVIVIDGTQTIERIQHQIWSGAEEMLFRK